MRYGTLLIPLGLAGLLGAAPGADPAEARDLNGDGFISATERAASKGDTVVRPPASPPLLAKPEPLETSPERTQAPIREQRAKDQERMKKERGEAAGGKD